MNNIKNKLNSKISWLFKLEPNAHLSVRLGTTYLVETETIFLKVL